MKRQKRVTAKGPSFPHWGTALFLLILWQILLWAQNPGLMSDDSGEMIAGAYRLGLPHPPGYPLYCLLGRSFSMIPVGTIAFRFNLLASLVALTSVVVLMRTCRDLWLVLGRWAPKGRGFGAMLMIGSGATLFFCRSFFAQSLTAKGLVYLTTFLIITALVWWRVKSAVDPIRTDLPRKKYFVLFLLMLGFTSHWQTQVLLLPFILLWCHQDKVRWSIKSILIGASLGITVLSLYLYLPLRSVLLVQPKWGDPVTWKGFLWVVTRKLSSNTETFIRGWDHYVLWIGEYFRLMTSCWLGWFWVLGLAGVVFLFWTNRKLFWSLSVLYGVVLYSLIAVPRDEVLFLMNVYLISIHGVFVLMVFLGTSFLVGWTGQRIHIWGWILISGFLLSLVVWGFRIGKEEDKSRYTLASDFGVNILKGLPRHSLLLAEGDHAVMPLWYLQYVEGLRPDVTVEPSVFLLHDWGWRQLTEKLPAFRPLTGSGTSLQERLKGLTALSGKYPLFYTLDRQYLGAELRRLPGIFEPSGLVRRWEPRVPDSGQIFRSGWTAGRVQRLRGLEAFRNDHSVDVSTNEIYRYYANQYFETGQVLQSMGKSDLALKDLDQGLYFLPSAAWVFSDMAVIFGKKGYFELARRLCGKGIEADPGYLPSYLNLANGYLTQGARDKARAVYEWAFAEGVDSAGMRERIKEMEVAPLASGPVMKDRDANAYRKLGEDMRSQGIPSLSDMALSIARDLESGKTRENP